MTGLYFILFYFHALWQWVTGKIQKIYFSLPCDSSSAVQCRAMQSQVPVLVEILTLLYVFNFRHKLTLLWKTLSIYIQDMFFSPQAPPRFLRIHGGALWEINISTRKFVVLIKKKYVRQIFSMTIFNLANFEMLLQNIFDTKYKEREMNVSMLQAIFRRRRM